MTNQAALAPVVPFRRARRPEEREQRREAILRAAAELFDMDGPQGAGLNAIAAQAGFTKSNIYRYFESREEVLLNLLLAEFADFLPRLEGAVAICREDDIAGIARAATQSLLDFPRLGRLWSMLAFELEQNISEETVVALKEATNEHVMRIAFALHDKLPRATMEDCAFVAMTMGTLVAGIWPAAHPAPNVAKVLAMPRYAHLRLDPARDLERAIDALIHSIA